jgi:very-short-patch-repair endonuclease
MLWKRLKARGLAGLHFRKQHPFGPYVLDFYCDTAKLCVEVDGQSHGFGARLRRTASAHGFGARPERDARRDAMLAEHGVRTLRLRAAYVLDEMDGALAMILSAANGIDPMI